MFYTNGSMVVIVVEIVFLLTARMFQTKMKRERWKKRNAILWRFAAARDLFLHFFFLLSLSPSFIASLHKAAPSKPDPFTHTRFFHECMRYESDVVCDPLCLRYDSYWFWEHFVMSVRHIALWCVCTAHGKRHGTQFSWCVWARIQLSFERWTIGFGAFDVHRLWIVICKF